MRQCPPPINWISGIGSRNCPPWVKKACFRWQSRRHPPGQHDHEVRLALVEGLGRQRGQMQSGAEQAVLLGLSSARKPGSAQSEVIDHGGQPHRRAVGGDRLRPAISRIPVLPAACAAGGGRRSRIGSRRSKPDSASSSANAATVGATGRGPWASCTTPRNEPPLVGTRWASISSIPWRRKNAANGRHGEIGEVFVEDRIDTAPPGTTSRQ